jgi:S1-C subfamily serine protease
MRRQVARQALTVCVTGAVAVGLTACSPPGDHDAHGATSQTPLPAGGVPAEDGTGYADLVERVAPSVVTIRTADGLGSGVVFRDDVVITNEHVVGAEREVVVEYADGTSSGGTVLAADAMTDIAAVRTERTGLPVPEYREELPRPGDPVLAIGSPLGFENTVTAGIVSGLHREIPGSTAETRALVDLMQTDAPISPGNSGGALLDTAGRVIGINEAYIPPSAGAESLGFAIPAATAVDVAEQLVSDGEATHPYLGVSVGKLTPAIRERFDVRADTGALVLGLADGGPAATAGMRVGDVIVRLADTAIRGSEDLPAALRDLEPGQDITITVVRDGEEQELRARVAARTP